MFGIGISDLGKRRTNNEDAFIIDEHLGFAIVCDGMGGHAAGEIASEQASKSVYTFLHKHQQAIFDLKQHETDENYRKIERLVVDSIQYACQRVYELAESNNQYKGMGTTLTMLMVIGNKAIFGHVGDSRLYLLRDNRLHQLSEDHTYVNELVKRGIFTPEEARNNAHAHAITRAIGMDRYINADAEVFTLLPNDTFLLSSDGFHDYISNNAILEALLDEPLETLPENLVKFANRKGGKDNITCVIVHPDSVPASHNIATSKDTDLQIDVLSKVKIFKALEPSEIISIFEKCEVVKMDKDITIIEENSPGDTLYMVLHGRVTISRNKKVLGTLETGEHFGEMAIFSNRDRNATVVTQQACVFLCMRRDQLETIMEIEKELAVKLLFAFARELSNRLDDCREQQFPRYP